MRFYQGLPCIIEALNIHVVNSIDGLRLHGVFVSVDWIESVHDLA